MFSPVIYIYIFTKVFPLLGRARQRSATLSLYPCSHTAPSSSEVRLSVMSKLNRRYFFACFDKHESTLGRDARSTLASCSPKTREEIEPVF